MCNQVHTLILTCMYMCKVVTHQIERDYPKYTSCLLYVRSLFTQYLLSHFKFIWIDQCIYFSFPPIIAHFFQTVVFTDILAFCLHILPKAIPTLTHIDTTSFHRSYSIKSNFSNHPSHMLPTTISPHLPVHHNELGLHLSWDRSEIHEIVPWRELTNEKLLHHQSLHNRKWPLR